MLARSHYCAVAFPLHRSLNTAESLACVDYLALNQNHLALRHWSKVGNIQCSSDASIRPEPGLRDRRQSNRRADVEKGSSAAAM